MKEKILVSIIVPTYNQSEYLELTLLSIINQKTNFHYEIIISNDASTDNSDSVIQDIIKSKVNNENISIKYFNHEKNLGVIKNWMFCIEQCEGKYIAICEGDNYWIDENKLQKQTDFLEQNHDYGLVFTNSKRINNNDIYENVINIHPDDSKYKYLLPENIIPTLTTLFRNDQQVIEEYFHLLNTKNWTIADYPLWFLINKRYKIHFLKDYTAVYRITSNTTSRPNDVIKKYLNTRTIYEIRKYNIDKDYDSSDMDEDFTLASMCFLLQNYNKLANFKNEIINNTKRHKFRNSKKEIFRQLFLLSIHSSILRNLLNKIIK